MQKEVSQIQKKQKRILIFIIVGIFLIILVFTYSSSKPRGKPPQISEMQVDLPGKELNPEDIRLSTLESKNELVEQKIKDFEFLLSEQQKEVENKEAEKRHLQEELEELKQELLQTSLYSDDTDSLLSPPLSTPNAPRSNRLEFHVRVDPESDIGNVLSTIPAGTTAKAIFLSSVDAPCGVHSSADPQPVKLRFLSNGHLPHKVQAKLKGALLIGSAYGNLSSERVFIRVERMTQVKKNGDFIETDVAGYVSGEDGKYGVRGVVVDRSNMLIASAAAAGFLDGVNQYLQATINAQTLAQATQGLPSRDVINLEVLKSSSLNGVSTGLDKLSDYFIKRAEQLQPVIQIAAGRIVDITFTHSTELGDLHTKEKIQRIRERSRENG